MVYSTYGMFAFVFSIVTISNSSNNNDMYTYILYYITEGPSILARHTMSWSMPEIFYDHAQFHHSELEVFMRGLLDFPEDLLLLDTIKNSVDSKSLGSIWVSKAWRFELSPEPDSTIQADLTPGTPSPTMARWWHTAWCSAARPVMSFCVGGPEFPKRISPEPSDRVSLFLSSCFRLRDLRWASD